MPIDLSPTESETKQFEQMAAGEAIEAPQPEPQPEPKPDPQPEPEKKADPEPKPPTDEAEKAKLQRQVPFAAVMEERGKRKSAEEQLRAANEELTRLRAGVQPQPKADPVTAETDPIAVIQRLESELTELKRGQQQAGEFNAFQNTVISKEQEYVRENPDYPKMVEFLKESRAKELRDGLGFNDQQIMAALTQEARDTAAYALQNDLNPAEVFARLALAKGWKAAEPAKDPTPKPDPAAVAKLATLAEGQKLDKSLSSAGGGAPDSTPSLEAIAKMSGAEFDKFWKNGTIRQLMG